MTKFMVLYSSMASASELMANASPEEMKTSLDAWLQWRDEASKEFKVEFGLPLQPFKQVTPSGVSDSTSKVSGYSIVEGESKEALLELLKTHPHLKRQGASIDVLEMLPMPGV